MKIIKKHWFLILLILAFLSVVVSCKKGDEPQPQKLVIEPPITKITKYYRETFSNICTEIDTIKVFENNGNIVMSMPIFEGDTNTIVTYPNFHVTTWSSLPYDLQGHASINSNGATLYTTYTIHNSYNNSLICSVSNVRYVKI